MLANIFIIIVVALLLSQIIGWEMVITIVVFAGIMLMMKFILAMVPVPIAIIMALGVVGFVGLLFVARHLAQAHTEKKYPPDSYFHKIRAEIARTVC